MRAFIIPLCVLILHTPAGTALRFDSKQVSVWQPLPSDYSGAAAGAKSVVNSGGQRFFVTETAEQIDQMRENCGEE